MTDTIKGIKNGDDCSRSHDLTGSAPVRLCCGGRHFGAVCPDGQVMCCLCFGRFNQDKLAVNGEGQKTDVCRNCHDQEQNTKLGQSDE